MMDPNGETRHKNLAYVEQRLALAEEVGARCCVNIAGSYDPKRMRESFWRNWNLTFLLDQDLELSVRFMNLNGDGIAATIEPLFRHPFYGRK